ncbi:MAG: hypothetical protein ACI9XU_001860 [Arenicella sp.]|jgi:hypothetical protein
MADFEMKRQKFLFNLVYPDKREIIEWQQSFDCLALKFND